MQKLIFVAGSIFFTVCCLFASVVNAVEPSVNVVDEEGKPITQFEVMFNAANMGRKTWEQRDDGTIKIPAEYKDAAFIDVLIRADDFASTVVRYEDPKNGVLKESKGTIALKKGKSVKLQLKLWEGAKWPEGALPEVYFAAIKDFAEIMKQPMNRKQYAAGARELDFGMAIKPDGENAFKLQLADDTPPFYVAVHHDGFLRYFSAGPFTMADVKDGVLTVDVPKPARLELKFDTSAAKEDELPKGVMFNVLAKLAGGSGRYLEVGREKFETVKDAALSLVDLPAGEYRYTVLADPEVASQAIRRDEVHPSPFHDVGLVKLASGESKTVDVKFVPLDMNVTHGDRTAVVHIVKPNQQPAAGKKVTIAYIDQHYGPIPVFNGEVPESGTITQENIAQGKKMPLVGFSGYIVQAGGESLGQFNFTDDQKRGEFTFRLPIGVGDEAPDLDLIDVNTGKHTRLSEFRGKGVWLELWATWCGPCQPAMAELVKAYGEHREEWEGKVAVVPVSVDDTSDVVVPHTRDRGWDVFPQYWTERAKDRTNFGSSAASQFGVSGVPTAYIIGPDGKVRWTGHPASATRNGGSLAEFIKAKLTD